MSHLRGNSEMCSCVHQSNPALTGMCDHCTEIRCPHFVGENIVDRRKGQSKVTQTWFKPVTPQMHLCPLSENPRFLVRQKEACYPIPGSQSKGSKAIRESCCPEKEIEDTLECKLRELVGQELGQTRRGEGGNCCSPVPQLP